MVWCRAGGGRGVMALWIRRICCWWAGGRCAVRLSWIGILVGWRGSRCGELMELLIDHGMAVECRVIGASYLNYGQNSSVWENIQSFIKMLRQKFMRR